MRSVAPETAHPDGMVGRGNRTKTRRTADACELTLRKKAAPPLLSVGSAWSTHESRSAVIVWLPGVVQKVVAVVTWLPVASVVPLKAPRTGC
jgi:hypothetical protein